MAVHYMPLVLVICALVSFVTASKAGFESSVRRVRYKRHLTDDGAITAALATYTKQLEKLKRRIAWQEEAMSRRNKRILFLKRRLREKGDKHELADLETKIGGDLAKIKKEAELPSLKHFNLGLDAQSKAQQALKRKMDQEAAVIPAIRKRVVDNKAICRDVVTAWKSGADGLIGELSEHSVECKTNEFIKQFFLERESTDVESRIRYRYSCCRLNLKDNWKKAGS